VAAGQPEAQADSSRVFIRIPAGAHAPRVLIVDDEPLNGELMKDLLSGMAFDVRAVESGSAALSLHADFLPELVLMDLRMQGMDGFETTRRLRAAGSTAFIIAFTASVLTEAEQEALAAGADDFVRKPYRESELLVKIARALKLPHGSEPLAAAGASASLSAPLSELIAQLPSELIAQLRVAVVQARRERIERLIEQAATHSGPAAAQLGALARQFQYETLLSALERS
jgi:CheY-like chemotaxis protein